MKIKYKKIILMLMVIIMYQISIGQNIRVGYFDFKGFIEKTETGEHKGYGVEYLDKISAYSDLTFSYIPGNLEELIGKLKNKELDMLCLVIHTDEREEYFDYSRYSFGIPEGRLYTKLSSPIFYKDFKFLDNKRIGLMEGSLFKESIGKYEKENKINFKRNYYKTEKEIIKALDEGKIDIIATEIMSKHKNLKLLDSFPIENYYFVSYKNNNFMKKFNEAQSKIIWLNKNLDLLLYKKYYGDQSGENVLNLTREEFQYIKAKSKISVGMIGIRNILSSYNKETKEFKGIEPGIIKKINEISGLNINMVPVYPNKDLVKALKNNEFDLIMRFKKTSNMNDYNNLLVSIPYINYEFSIVKKRDFSFENIREYRVTIPKKLQVLREYLNYNFHGLKIIDSSKGELLNKILDNEADVAIIQNYEAQYYLQMPKYLPLVISNYGFYNLDSSFVANEGNKTLISIINKSINRLLNTNEIEKIINNSISENVYKLTILDIINQYQIFIIIILLLIIFIVAILFRIIKLNKENLKKTLGNNRKLVETNNKLKIVTNKANIASKAKSDFLSQMSHEIRTPLNGILGMTRLALSEKNIESKVKNYLENIEKSGVYLLEIINDILDISKIESKKILLTPEIVNVNNFIENISNMVSIRAEEKEINFKIETINSKYPYQYFDKLRVQQILINIIGNAIKYTPNKGEVILKSSYIESENKIFCLYEVKDNGVGMSEDFLVHMFKPFEQEKNELSKYSEGTGLGLSISKKIIDLMGGEITVKSVLGEGSHFTIKIPVLKISKEEYFKFLEKKKSIKKVSKIKGIIRILVVEDHPINELVVRKILEKKGYIVESVSNGMEAVKIFENSKINYYNLILMDIRMPIMDGYEATIKIRSLNRKDAKIIPIIALSANAFEEDKIKSLEFGMNGHLGKPIEIKELEKIINKMLNI